MTLDEAIRHTIQAKKDAAFAYERAGWAGSALEMSHQGYVMTVSGEVAESADWTETYHQRVLSMDFRYGTICMKETHDQKLRAAEAVMKGVWRASGGEHWRNDMCDAWEEQAAAIDWNAEYGRIRQRLARIALGQVSERLPRRLSKRKSSLGVKPKKAAKLPRQRKPSKAKLKAGLLLAHGPVCQMCEWVDTHPKGVLQLDRVLPGRDGGEYVDGNVRLLCQPCNLSRNGGRPRA